MFSRIGSLLTPEIGNENQAETALVSILKRTDDIFGVVNLVPLEMPNSLLGR